MLVVSVTARNPIAVLDIDSRVTGFLVFRFSPFIASVIRFSIVFISFVPFHSVRISVSLLANRWFCFLVCRTGPATL